MSVSDTFVVSDEERGSLMNEQVIKEALNEAYSKAGHNAYFGDGFNAGVEFVLKNKVEELKKGIEQCYSEIADKEKVIADLCCNYEEEYNDDEDCYEAVLRVDIDYFNSIQSK